MRASTICRLTLRLVQVFIHTLAVFVTLPVGRFDFFAVFFGNRLQVFVVVTGEYFLVLAKAALEGKLPGKFGDTQVTDAGRARLREALPQCQVQ